jgi:hypothetical protein
MRAILSGRLQQATTRREDTHEAGLRTWAEPRLAEYRILFHDTYRSAALHAASCVQTRFFPTLEDEDTRKIPQKPLRNYNTGRRFTKVIMTDHDQSVNLVLMSYGPDGITCYIQLFITYLNYYGNFKLIFCFPRDALGEGVTRPYHQYLIMGTSFYWFACSSNALLQIFRTGHGEEGLKQMEDMVANALDFLEYPKSGWRPREQVH